MEQESLNPSVELSYWSTRFYGYQTIGCDVCRGKRGRVLPYKLYSWRFKGEKEQLLGVFSVLERYYEIESAKFINIICPSFNISLTACEGCTLRLMNALICTEEEKENLFKVGDKIVLYFKPSPGSRTKAANK